MIRPFFSRDPVFFYRSYSISRPGVPLSVLTKISAAGQEKERRSPEKRATNARKRLCSLFSAYRLPPLLSSLLTYAQPPLPCFWQNCPLTTALAGRIIAPLRDTDVSEVHPLWGRCLFFSADGNRQSLLLASSMSRMRRTLSRCAAAHGANLIEKDTNPTCASMPPGKKMPRRG